MSRNMQRGHKPTGKDVYNDASKILEELLEGRIDKDLRVDHNIRRTKTTGPNIQKLSDHTEESGNAVARSKSLPGSYREPTEGELIQKGLGTLQAEACQKQNTQFSDPDASGSSADTEDNLSHVSEKRRKKNFFKRAKERLLHTVHRNKNQGHVKDNDRDTHDRTESRKQKSKKKNGKVVSESKHHVTAHTGEGKSIDYTDERGHKDKEGSVHTKVHSVKTGTNIWSSFRKSKKPVRIPHLTDRRENDQENNTDGDGKRRPQPSLRELTTKQGMPPVHPVNQTLEGEQEDAVLRSYGFNAPADRSRHSRHRSPSSVPTVSTPSSGGFNVAASENSRIITSETSSSDNIQHTADTSRSRVSSTMPSIKSLPSIKNNVLDSPGEDIEYIDASDSETRNKLDNKDNGNRTRQLRASGAPFLGETSFHNVSKPLNWQQDNKHLTDFETGDRVVSMQRANGNTETTTLTRAAVAPEVSTDEVYDELDGLMDEPGMPQNPAPDREVLYSIIAQRLIDMGDSYSASASDKKPRSADLEAKAPPTPLEEEIITYLRTVGDNVTKKTEQDLYQRFRSTMQNSLGSEISWHQVAVLFYSTKGVISAVGRGTRAALLAKEFTLQYVNDTFASWIIDQGGFDILLSSEESDLDLD